MSVNIKNKTATIFFEKINLIDSSKNKKILTFKKMLKSKQLKTIKRLKSDYSYQSYKIETLVNRFQLVMKKNFSLHLYITFTDNNIFLTVTDPNNKVIYKNSAGQVAVKISGLTRQDRTSPIIAPNLVDDILRINKNFKNFKFKIFIKNSGKARIALLKAIARSGLKVDSISSVNSIMHNGTRTRKKRRK